MTTALAALAVVGTFCNVTAKVIVVEGRIGMYVWVAVVQGLLTIGLSVWLGRRIGAAGVMVATVLAHAPSVIYLLWRSLRLTGMSPASFTRALAPRIGRVAVVGIVVALVGARLARGTLIQVLGVALVCGICAVIGVMVIGLDGPDRTNILLVAQRFLRMKR
jgi:hypothetical protein